MLVNIKSTAKRQIIDITDQLNTSILNNDNRGKDASICIIVVMHTTAAITTADLDPGTDLDFLDFLQAITPQIKYRHPHNPAHAPDHLLASLIGPSVNLPIKDGQLQLGSWQRVILVELDGPRERSVEVRLL